MRWTQRAHNVGDVIVSSPLAPFCGLYFSESKVATPAHLQRTAFDSMLALMANDDHGVYSAYDPPNKTKKRKVLARVSGHKSPPPSAKKNPKKNHQKKTLRARALWTGNK